MSGKKRANPKAEKQPAATRVASANLERRILILAPTANDARRTLDFLSKTNLPAQACRDVAQLCHEFGQGCGAMVLAEETLGQSSISLLVKTLAAQPSWSDIPIILITSGGEAGQTRLRRLAVFGPGGNVTLLERPFRPAALISTIEVALRSRQRQYEVRKLVQTQGELVGEREAQAQLFDITLSSIADLAYTFDLEGNWIYANKPLLKLWGKTLPEITGKSSLQLGYPPGLAHRLKQQVKEVIATRKPFKGETYFTDAAGVEDYHEYIFSPVLAADGTVTAVCGTTRLTTERKRAEAFLKQNGAMFSSVVDLAPTGVFVVDAQFLVRQINPRALPLFAQVQPVIGHDFGKVMVTFWGPEVGAEVSKIFRHTLATGEPYKSPRFAEHRHDLNVDQAYEWEIQRVTLPDGSLGVVCYFNDITETERNKSNLAFLAAVGEDLIRLQQVDEIMQAVGARIGGYLKLSICCFVEINEAADTSNVTHEWRRDAAVPTLLGKYRLAEYLSADFQNVLRAGNVFVVNDTETDPRTDQKNYAALQLRSFICVPLVHDGKWKFMFDVHHSSPHNWREDEIELVREITARLWTRLERARAEEALRETKRELQIVNQRLQLATQAGGIGAFEWNIQADTNYWTPELEALYGLPPGGFTGRNGADWARHLHPEDREEALAVCRQAIEQRTDFNAEFRVIWPDGTVRWLSGRAQVICDAAGQPWRLVGVNMDITERRRATQALQQLAAIVESSADAIISKNLNSIITSWNHGAEQLFGYSAEEVVGQSINILIPPDRLNEEPNILERIRRGERIEHYETIRRRKDGKLLEISLTVSPIKDASGKVIGASKIARDVTEQKQAERELERAHKEAVAASRAKDDFLAALSHELRTPLNPALLLASESADNHELPETVRLNFETIRKNIELEARLIDDLLDLTRITTGKMVLNKSRVNVHAVLNDAIATTQAEQQEKKLHLDIRLNASQSWVEGDGVRLQQVFWNILKNAVKFTPVKGKITLETSIKEDDKLLVTITDTGIGMNAEEVARVFTAFAQGDHAGVGGSHRFGGLGLGLAISRNLVELHSGKIVAHSTGNNQGSTFAIELPLAKEIKAGSKKDCAQKNGSEALKETLDSLSVLLVEDHEITRTVLAQLLTRRNLRVVTADSMAKARDIARQDKFDLLISDIGLPDGNGNDLMSEFQKEYGLKGIALTGYGMEEDIARGKAAGFVTHLIKPVRIQSLENALALVKTVL